MTTQMKKIKNEVYEVLEHGETPGYKRVFHIVICVALLYFLYIFTHLH